MNLAFWRTPPEPQLPLLDEPDPDLLLAYLTLGGAEVHVLAFPHRTRYTYQGRPYVGNPGDGFREVDGFRVWCSGCGQRIGIGSFDPEDYLDTELGQARDDANAHAGSCRALPSRLVRPA